MSALLERLVDELAGLRARVAALERIETPSGLVTTTHTHAKIVASDGTPDPAFHADAAGNCGLRVAVPLAALHLPEGSAVAGTAPLKFTSGAVLGTPEAGSVEFYDGRWYITGTAKQRVIDRTGGVIVATTTVAATTTETTLWTESLSANAMKVGRIYKMHCGGIANNASSSDDLTFNLYFGGTLVGTYAPAMGRLATDAAWHVDANITVRTIGAGGTCAIHTDMEIGAFAYHVSSLQAIDTTVANAVTLKVKWSKNTSGNTISIYQGWLELKN